MNIVHKAGAWLALLAVLATSAPAAAEDILAPAKVQYESAAYEEALETLADAAGMTGVNRIELEQYRAMCLIALGRTEEAAEAVAAIIAADPRYIPPSSVASPKVLSLVATVRAERLPAVIRDLVVGGRAAFEARRFDEAAGTFALALALIDDEAVKEWTDRQDVRVLVEGFSALASASARESEAETTAASAEPDVSAGGSEAGSPAASNGAPEPTVADAAVQPPVAIHQQMPPWVPPDALVGSRSYHGLLKVAIGVDGRVKEAKMEQATHPAYDVRLVTAARQWVFRPAMRLGKPVESEQVIAVQLHPRQ